jgi:catechol 2,3-dioxygenase-like lactoylglutathione lyase family enzyme
MAAPTFRLRSTVLGTPDPAGLAAFWVELLGYRYRDGTPDPGDDWVVIKPGDGADDSAGLAFQLETEHVPPTWPAGPGDQQMQLHLDVGVEDLPAAVARAEELGARQASYQPQELVRIMIDPAGHPFCLFAPGG